MDSGGGGGGQEKESVVFRLFESPSSAWGWAIIARTADTEHPVGGRHSVEDLSEPF